MKSFVKALLTVVIIAAILFGLAFCLNGLATKNAQTIHLQTMTTLLPGSDSFQVETYSGEDPLIRSVHKGQTGFVVETAAAGYADEITVLVGVTKEGSVTGIVVKDMHETLGLGANALTDWQFLAQFLKTTGEAEVGVTVDALTGATVTSKTIARCVNSAVAFVTGADTTSSATSWGG